MLIGLLSARTTASLRESLVSNSQKSITDLFLNNRSSQAGPKLANINSNEPLYYSFTVGVNKFDRSCNTIDDPYAPI